MNSDWSAKLQAIAVAIIAALFLVIMLQFGRLPNIDTDEVFYKAAGRELATTGHFAAPELTGLFGVQPPPEEVWLLYPPLYPLLFGGVVELFGFGWKQCVMFDAFIKVFLAAVTWQVTRRLSTGNSRWPAFFAAVSVLLMARSVIGRPDELATALGMVGLLPLIRRGAPAPLTYIEAVVSGFFFGLCAGTSAVAAIVLGFVALAFCIARAHGVSRFAVMGLVWGSVVVVAFATLVVSILWNHPDAYQQYFSHAKIIFHADTRSHWEKLAALVAVGWRVTVPVIGILVLGVIAGFSATRRTGLRQWATIWSGPLAGLGFILLVDPHLYAYAWFLGPYVLAASLASFSDPVITPNLRWPRVVYAGALVLLVALGSAETIRQTAIFARLPREQSIGHNAELLRKVIPTGAVVLSVDAWWFLGQDNLVYVTNIPAMYRDQADYVVLRNMDHLPSELEDYLRENFSPISDNRSTTPVTLLGVPLSQSVRGFGMLVLARRHRPVETLAGLTPATD